MTETAFLSSDLVHLASCPFPLPILTQGNRNLRNGRLCSIQRCQMGPTSWISTCRMSLPPLPTLTASYFNGRRIQQNGTRTNKHAAPPSPLSSRTRVPNPIQTLRHLAQTSTLPLNCITTPATPLRNKLSTTPSANALPSPTSTSISSTGPSVAAPCGKKAGARCAM
jgi:hypothetical protein